VLRLGLSRGLTGFGLQVRVGPGSIPKRSFHIVRKFSSIEMLDASPSDENSTEFSKHPRNDPTTRVGPRSRIPSLSSGVPGSEDHYPLVTLPIAKQEVACRPQVQSTKGDTYRAR